MINDITNMIYTTIKNNLTDVFVTQDYPEITPTFPCVVVNDIGYTEDVASRDSSGEFSNISGINFYIFSNNKDSRSECKKIRNQIDNILSEYKMTREFDESVPNYIDTTVYQRQLRYSFKIDKNGTIYRR